MGLISILTTAKRVEDKEQHLADFDGAHADTKFLDHALARIAVDGRVEVHRDLHDEDGGEDGPFLPTGESETEGVGRIPLVKNMRVAANPFDSLFALGERGRVGVVNGAYPDDGDGLI